MVTKIKKILVPLDGSKFSEKALQYACEMVKAFDAKIILLYVVEKSPTLNILDRNEYLKIIQKYGTNTLKKYYEVNNLLEVEGELKEDATRVLDYAYELLKSFE